MQLSKGSVSSLSPFRPRSELLRLLPTLRIENRVTATGCSKAPRGLRFHVGETGLCTSTLNYVPVTMLFAVVVFGSIYFLFNTSKSELAPAEDQGIIF